MPRFIVNVIETRTYHVDLAVDADTPEAALAKALAYEEESADHVNESLSEIADRYATTDDVRAPD